MEPPGEEGDENPWYVLESQEVPPVGERCPLKRTVTYDKQDTSHWCWAASAQTVIKYRNQTGIPMQCDVVNAVFETDLNNHSTPSSKLDCCLIGNEYQNPQNEIQKDSRFWCIKNGWPEQVFEQPQYNVKYSLIQYDSSTTDPQGLTWEEVTLQICDDKPFIFEVRWWGGGGHTLAVLGYRQTADGSPFVEVLDPGRPDGADFFVMPYEAYLGVPGDFIHDRDYINIR